MAIQAPRVIVKFRDSVTLPYADDIGTAIDQQTGDAWTALAQQFPGIRIYRLYRAVAQDDLNDLIQRAMATDPTYQPPNVFTFYVVAFPDAFDPHAVASALTTWPSVEFAYPEAIAAPPTGSLNPGSYALNYLQGYQSPAPFGVDVPCAWSVPGGDGARQGVIDLECGWTLDHDDFVVHNPQLLFGGIDDAERSHGTSVLGIICARRNTKGIIGIVPHVDSINVVSYASNTGDSAASNIPDAIVAAIKNLVFGNVLVLEVELGFLPCETDPSCYWPIRLATALGISVVEAAGNGTQNLDVWLDAAGHPTLFRDSHNTWFKDSRAIIVAAATIGNPHRRNATTNYGTRVDCYAWGDRVKTSASANANDKSSHTLNPEFRNTSAATAIVAGAALSVQGMVEAATGLRLAPASLRNRLRQGTGSIDPIGVMPDLCAIAGQIAQGVATPS